MNLRSALSTSNRDAEIRGCVDPTQMRGETDFIRLIGEMIQQLMNGRSLVDREI